MKPEVLAPAGDLETLRVALAAGADAVYCGLAEGFNARAKTAGIPIEDLPAVAREVHLANARIYITFNTLIEENELDRAAHLIARIARAGADAIIVQDWAVALCARSICPDLALHASTQMTLTSPEAVKQAEIFGFSRVVAPRELTSKELLKFTQSTPLEVEAFVHGALCISWSGQCNASENLGGGSANRGTCSQPCRMPYRLWIDEQLCPLPHQAYLLSPRDQCLVDAANFEQMGIASLKIEGRLKSPAYVASTVRMWRKRIDGQEVTARDKALSALAFSRSAKLGFFGGIDHQDLILGRSPAHRGLYCGQILRVLGRTIELKSAPNAPALAPGQGVAFEADHPSEELGGPLFGVQQKGAQITLDMGAMFKNANQLRVGQRVYLTSDPEVQKQVRRLQPPNQRLPLDLELVGRAGQPLLIQARSQDVTLQIQSENRLEQAHGGEGLTEDLLVQKLCAFGGTPYALRRCQIALEPGLHLPVSMLKTLRRQLVLALSDRIAAMAQNPADESQRWIPSIEPAAEKPLELFVLCRNLDQLKAVLSFYSNRLCITPELDFATSGELLEACNWLQNSDRTALYALPRIHLAGESPLGFYRKKMPIHGFLLRNLGALEAAKETGLALHGDPCLNVRNRASAAFYLNAGLQTVEGAGFLEIPAQNQRVTLYRKPPLFHMRHCLFAQHLGRPRDCRQACQSHSLKLEDHRGQLHRLLPGPHCRNTIYRESPEFFDSKLAILKGIRQLRIELTDEEAVERLLTEQCRQILPQTR